MQAPDRVPFRSGRLGGHFPRALAEDRGRPVGCGRPAEAFFGKLEFAGPPMRQSFGVVGDQRRLGRRELPRKGCHFIDPERLDASLDSDGVEFAPGEGIARKSDGGFGGDDGGAVELVGAFQA